MNKESVIIEKRDEIAFLILNQPETNNLLNETLFKKIAESLLKINEDNAVKLIIVKGSGSHFCMGGDIKRIAELGKLEARNFFLGLVKMYRTFQDIDKPSIAMVHGYAAAGGMGVALSCDLIVASEDARFGSTAVNAGLFCMNTSGIMLPRIVGTKKALELALTGDLITAFEAEKLGIVNKVVPSELLESSTMELAGKILSKNPVAVLIGRRNFYTCLDMEYNKALEHSAELFGFLAHTDAAKEGMSAFLESRKADYSQFK